MNDLVIETSYPLSFRKKEAEILGQHIHHRRSVEIVGMKRVGISNFLRFFLYHKDIVPNYINHHEKHIFIPVDLNDLIEREIHPFWILTFKRLLDAVEKFPVKEENKQKISTLFLNSIQSQDLFLTLEYLKQALQMILSENIQPTFFLIRFDRLEPAITPEFFHNLQGFVENSQRRLSFVFTSFKPLDQIKPEVFNRQELTSFSEVMDIKPANHQDMVIIYDTLRTKYNLCFTREMEKTLIDLSGGHVQYLHLMLMVLYEKLGTQNSNLSKQQIIEQVIGDERITLQSEEIWDSLSKDEQGILLKVANHKKTTIISPYLLSTGIIDQDHQVFSPLFEEFLHSMSDKEDAAEFTKKEHVLYQLLLANKDEVCERDTIIHSVWPEYEETGVSDWTIDRLIARLRSKMLRQKNDHSIVTVKTRGYKMV